MSIQAMQKVWHEADCSGSELLILLCLADHVGSDQEMVAWPSIALIARRSRMTERGAQKAIRRLEAKGLLAIEKGGGRSGTNRYRLHINPEPGFTGSEHENPEPASGGEHGSGVNSETQNPELCDIKPRTPVHPNLREPLEPTPLNPPRGKAGRSDVREQSSSAKVQFDEFWNVYPRKTAKAAAKAKFLRLVRSGKVTADELIDGAERYAAEVAERGPAPDGRIPMCNPTTWLSQGRWEDETAVPNGEDVTAGMTPEEREKFAQMVEEGRLAGAPTAVD
jgi:hypothetical protein